MAVKLVTWHFQSRSLRGQAGTGICECFWIARIPAAVLQRTSVLQRHDQSVSIFCYDFAGIPDA
jgi:hypothetical protein